MNVRFSNAAIIWDFDHSLINDNSDTWIPAFLDPSGGSEAQISNGRQAGTQWTKLMGEVVATLHCEKSITPMEINAAAGNLPVFEEIILSIQECHSRGYIQYIVSDANVVYIHEFLKAKGISHIFEDKVITNFGGYDSKGKLIIEAHQSYYRRDQPPHDCPHCPINLCKGSVLEELSLPPTTKVFYVGDGHGDLCPALRLKEGDIVLARKNFGLMKSLEKMSSSCQATVVTWADGKDVMNCLLDSSISTN